MNQQYFFTFDFFFFFEKLHFNFIYIFFSCDVNIYIFKKKFMITKKLYLHFNIEFNAIINANHPQLRIITFT